MKVWFGPSNGTVGFVGSDLFVLLVSVKRASELKYSEGTE